MAQEIINKTIPIGETDANTVTNLSLAFLGDSVYELVIRNLALLKLNGKAGDLNHITKEYSNAKTQALIVELIQDDFTEEEITRTRQFPRLSPEDVRSAAEVNR